MAEGSTTDPEDKTEEPSQRRLQQAVEKGDVAKSVEINNLFVLAAGTLGIMIAGGAVSRHLAMQLRGLIEHSYQITPQGDALSAVWTHAISAGLLALALPLGFIMLGGIAANLVQHGLVFSTEPLMPQVSRLSPLAGFKRIFGKQALVNLIKSLAKLAIVGIVMWSVLRGDSDRLDALTRTEVSGILPQTYAMVLKLFGSVLAVYAFIALGDYVFQRFSWHKRQRMSREELKQEFKETEGSPEVKARISRLRRERARRRMMSAVPKASVVITNPTHFAVALRYEAGMPAPVCVAKGMDALAQRIKAVAGDHGVPIIENPPLARALHKTVEIDDEVPEQHYKAVAEVIGLVMRLKRRRA